MAETNEGSRPPVYEVPAGVEQIKDMMRGKEPKPPARDKLEPTTDR